VKILHITPHLGGGVGTVICDWMKKDNNNKYVVASLDSINPKSLMSLVQSRTPYISNAGKASYTLNRLIVKSDVVILHYWPHPLIKELLSHSLPFCRMAIWCHNNSIYTGAELNYPDVWIDTSPIQGHGKYIWSTGDMGRFLEIKPKAHEGFNIGYVGTISYKKIHPEWYPMCEEIKRRIPEARFTFIGENLTAVQGSDWMTFTGKVDDVTPYLAEFDVFGYPLRPDHYGTAEQVLGEAMAAGVVPVVMDNECEKTIIMDAITGFICRSGKEYIKKIERLYYIKPQRDFVSKEARHRASYLYSLDTMISQWNDVFESMMRNPKKSRGTLLL
jgi:hypothetical protein